MKAKTINIANPKIFVSELKISTFNPVDSEANLANIKAFNDSFFEVGNPEVIRKLATSKTNTDLASNPKLLNVAYAIINNHDGYYPAPENMVFEVIESHSADGSESEKLAFVSFEPTKLITPEEVLMDWPQENVEVSSKNIEPTKEEKPDFNPFKKWENILNRDKGEVTYGWTVLAEMFNDFKDYLNTKPL